MHAHPAHRNLSFLLYAEKIACYRSQDSEEDSACTREVPIILSKILVCKYQDILFLNSATTATCLRSDDICLFIYLISLEDPISGGRVSELPFSLTNIHLEFWNCMAVMGIYVCTYVCMYVRIYVCMYVCMYVNYVCTYVCMYVCIMYVYIYM